MYQNKEIKSDIFKAKPKNDAKLESQIKLEQFLAMKDFEECCYSGQSPSDIYEDPYLPNVDKY